MVWVLKRKKKTKKKTKLKKKPVKASELGSQGRTSASLEQSSKTLNCFPPAPPTLSGACRLQDVFESGVTLVQEFCLFLSSPRAGILFCFVLFSVSCFLFPPCVLAGTHVCGCWPKGMFWSCQERRRLGSTNPQMNGAPCSLSAPRQC